MAFGAGSGPLSDAPASRARPERAAGQVPPRVGPPGGPRPELGLRRWAPGAGLTVRWSERTEYGSRGGR